MYYGFVIYWVMCGLDTFVRTRDKHHALLSAWAYQKKHPKAIVRIEACKDNCVPTHDNRIYEECCYGLSAAEWWDEAERYRRA